MRKLIRHSVFKKTLKPSLEPIATHWAASAQLFVIISMSNLHFSGAEKVNLSNCYMQ